MAFVIISNLMLDFDNWANICQRSPRSTPTFPEVLEGIANIRHDTLGVSLSIIDI